MKKITLLITVILAVFCVNAQQQVNNPKDADGYYIVKWDCANNTWAASNNMEVDETFTFAVDVTGTPWEAWLKETPTNAGATRSLALNKWTNFGDVSGDSHRLKPIKENIYGATWNIIQLATSMDVTKATGTDSITYMYGQLFGFEYTSDNPGAGWWMWPSSIPGGSMLDPGTGAIFRTLPYTGTKTSGEFYNDDYGNELFGTNYPVKGYAPACSVSTAVESITQDSPIVGHEYYNLQGSKLSKAPNSGLYIDKVIKANGSFKATKIFKENN